MKSPDPLTHGDVAILTPEERFLEIRDIFVAALRRLKASDKSPQGSANKLDTAGNPSVYASTD